MDMSITLLTSVHPLSFLDLVKTIQFHDQTGNTSAPSFISLSLSHALQRQVERHRPQLHLSLSLVDPQNAAVMPLSFSCWREEGDRSKILHLILCSPLSLSLTQKLTPDQYQPLSPGHHHAPMCQRSRVEHPAALFLLLSHRWTPKT
jgi:hypothetical protein